MNYLKKLTMTLALLLAATAGARAQQSSMNVTTSTEVASTLFVSDHGSLTMNIAEGATLTALKGIYIYSGATLTVTGGGTLIVYGENGADGKDAETSVSVSDTGVEEYISQYPTRGGEGTDAISGQGQLIVENATVIATGGNGGRGGVGTVTLSGQECLAEEGGYGGFGINGVTVSLKNGSLTAIGGLGGFSPETQDNQSNGLGFYTVPSIAGAVISWSDDGNTYTRYSKNGNDRYENHRWIKVEPKGFEVAMNDAMTEASFEMPSYDLTATYTVKRDMSVDMNVTVGDGSDGVRFRVKQEGGFWHPVDITSQAQLLALLNVTDQIENTNLVIGTDYEFRFYAVDDEGQPTGEGMNLGSFQFAPGRYAVRCFAKEGSNYVGEAALSNVFTLFQGYELEIPAGEYATYYMDEPLSVDESTPEGQLYTISSVNLENATATATELSVAEANTPLLVKNNADETKRILLVPSVETADEVTVAPEFKGTLVDKTFTDEDMHDADHYVCNGRAFVWVMDAGVIAPNRAWLEIEKEEVESARTLQIVFGDATGVNDVIGAEDGNDGWYDLNGRKLRKAPAQKGVFIQNGNKVLVK